MEQIHAPERIQHAGRIANLAKQRRIGGVLRAEQVAPRRFRPAQRALHQFRVGTDGKGLRDGEAREAGEFLEPRSEHGLRGAEAKHEVMLRRRPEAVDEGKAQAGCGVVVGSRHGGGGALGDGRLTGERGAKLTVDNKKGGRSPLQMQRPGAYGVRTTSPM